MLINRIERIIMKRILTACIITLIATSSVHANKVLFMNDSDEQIYRYYVV